MRFAAALAAAALVLLATGCGGLAIGPSPCRAEVAPSGDAPSHRDPALEDRIPDEVAGETLIVGSTCANVSDPGGLNMTPEFLEAVGVEIDDVSYAGSSPQIGDALAISISAFRYHGASEDRIRAAIVEAVESAGATMREGSRAGRDVHVGEGVAAGTTVYVADDTLYLLSGSDEEVDELLGGLP